MNEVQQTFTEEGRAEQCHVSAGRLVLRLPELAGLWQDCKEELAWPNKDALAALDVTFAVDSININVRALLATNLTEGGENQLLWFLKRRTKTFVEQECRVETTDSAVRSSEACVRLKLISGDGRPATTIVDLYSHLSSRMEESGLHCVWCGESLPRGRLWPSLCEEDACIAGFERTRRPGDLHLLFTDPDAARLLVSWARAASEHVNCWSAKNSVERVFFGVSKPPGRKEEEEEKEGRNKRWRSLCEMLEKLPESLSNIRSEAELVTALVSADPDLPISLAWIFSSFRGRLVKLNDDKVFKLISRGVRKQFKGLELYLVYPGNSKRMQAFSDRLEKSNDLGFYFHGSLWPRWHAIAREDLKNFSKTEHEANQRPSPGYPAGVFLSRSFSLSALYAGPRLAPFYRQCCVALCGVVHSNRLVASDTVPCLDSLELVATDENDVMVRLLMVYDAFTREGRAEDFTACELATALTGLHDFDRVSKAIQCEKSSTGMAAVTKLKKRT